VHIIAEIDINNKQFLDVNEYKIKRSHYINMEALWVF